MLSHTLPHFLTDEAGAVTVDWVVLTAALVGVGLAVIAVLSGGIQDISRDIAADLVAVDPGASTITATP